MFLTSYLLFVLAISGEGQKGAAFASEKKKSYSLSGGNRGMFRGPIQQNIIRDRNGIHRKSEFHVLLLFCHLFVWNTSRPLKLVRFALFNITRRS